LVDQGICRTQVSAVASLERLKNQLHTSNAGVNNIFLHITNRCQLNCTHCYAEAGQQDMHTLDMPVHQIRNLIVEAELLGISVLALTGGEPFIHNDWGQLLEHLSEIKPEMKHLRLFLSTNLAYFLSEKSLQTICHLFDTVGVSVDGDQHTHDNRRGAGSYNLILRNVERVNDYIKQTESLCTLSLEYTPSPDQSNHESLRHVYHLAKQLGLHPPKILPMLPLGRAANLSCAPVSKRLSAYLPSMEIIRNGFYPTSRCLGSSLHIDPNGDCYPCYACHWPEAWLGNIKENGLKGIFSNQAYTELLQHNVDQNPKCRACDVRYLCGGVCLAWMRNQPNSYNTPPPECSNIKELAYNLFETATDYINHK